MQVLHFPADHPAIHTNVGKLSGQVISVSGSAGFGLYGPYIKFPAGACLARIRFEGLAHGSVRADISAASGQQILFARDFDLDALNGGVIDLFAYLPRALSKCEVRLYCHSGAQANIRMVEINFGPYTQTIEQPLRAYLSSARHKIHRGRDIEAGYARGMGIEFGGLRPIIEADPDWIAATAAARGRSIVPPAKLMNLFLIIKYSDIAVGNIIEFGSFRGGAALFFACLAKRLRKHCKVFALDTYEGMPVTDRELDRHRSGGFADVDFAGFEKAREKSGLDNLIVLKGLFQDTVKMIAPEDNHFFLSHVDSDIYESVVFSIEYSKQHAVCGSYIVLDDPLTSDCLGAMLATEEYLIQQGLFSEQTYPHLVYRYPAL